MAAHALSQVGVWAGQLGEVPLAQISLQGRQQWCVCVCVCVCVFLWARWGGGVGGGSSGPTWARPQALQQDPPGAHQQTAHQLLGEELGGHGEVPVGRMLVVLMVVVGEGAPRRLGEEPSKGTVYRM